MILLKQISILVLSPLKTKTSSSLFLDKRNRNLSINKVQQESAGHQEDLNIENKKGTSEANNVRQAYQVAVSPPPVQLPPGYASPFYTYLAGGLLALGGVFGIFTLVYRFKTRNKD